MLTPKRQGADEGVSDSDVSIVDSAANGRLLVVAQSSDVVPATYYLFDREIQQLRYLTSQRPCY